MRRCETSRRAVRHDNVSSATSGFAESDGSRHASSPFAVAVPVVLSLGLAGCAAADRNVRARRCSRMAFGLSGDATADGIRKS